MPETIRNCPLCGSDRSRLFDQRVFRGQPVSNRLCQDCGLVYQSPRMTEKETTSFYAEEYRLLYEGSASPTTRNLSDQKGRAESLFSFASPNLGVVKRHLDIGCSFGLLLKHFQENYQCQAVGIEPGEGHRAHAKTEGLTVYATLEELEGKEEARFDLISLAHVLEHLPDPVGYLDHLRKSLLQPDGWLLLEVPNLYAHDSFEIAHLVSFSQRTLVQTLAKAGYEIVKVAKHGNPRSALLPIYLTILAHPVLDPSKNWRIVPEKLAGVKRQAGMIRRRILERLFPKQAWIA